MKHLTLILGSVIFLSGCFGAAEPVAETASGTVKIGEVTDGGSGDILKTESFVTAIPSGEITTPDHGKEVDMAYAAVNGLGETKANGVASAHYLEDGATVIGLQVNIAAAPDGFFYEGWAVSPDEQTWISLGHLRNPLNDARHNVRFETSKNLKEMAILRVTLESDDGNPEHSAAVAEAKLKPTSR